MTRRSSNAKPSLVLADEISGATVIAMAAIGVLIVAGWSAALFGPRATAGSGRG